uniref:Uncharacterized protein n=1 Tax=Latimeria chalumnae TaxID=7897 RepID=H3AEW7_LATCH
FLFPAVTTPKSLPLSLSHTHTHTHTLPSSTRTAAAPGQKQYFQQEPART